MQRKFLVPRAVSYVTAIAVQLLILISIIIQFDKYLVLYYEISTLLSIIVVLVIINNNSNPAYKIAWIIPVLLFPIFGVIIYLFFGGNKLSKRMKKKMSFIDRKTRQALAADPVILAEIRARSETAATQANYIQHTSSYPLYRNSISEYLPTGEAKFERLKEELQKAEQFIFLEYFIIEAGVMWDSILDILKAKARQGVDVRLIYDDAGCLTTLPYGYDKKLTEAGIKCRIFNPMIPVLTSRQNNRDHRKIVVIDGLTGFTGGINLADEYINVIGKYGHWKDTAILLKGDAVWSLTIMFLSMWGFLSGMDEDLNQFRKFLSANQVDLQNGYIQPYAGSPLDKTSVGESVYLNLINKARHYVYITTPYLIIDYDMVISLCAAAESGIDVRIITPHHADKWYVHSVTRSFYKILTQSGVKIYEYTPGFIHSKSFVVDDEYGVVGTINLDYRSLYLHFECAVWLYRCDCISDIKDDFVSTLEVCQEVTKTDIEAVKWYKTLVRSALRVFAPLM
jgi:cardiolipin synthase